MKGRQGAVQCVWPKSIVKTDCVHTDLSLQDLQESLSLSLPLSLSLSLSLSFSLSSCVCLSLSHLIHPTQHTQKTVHITHKHSTYLQERLRRRVWFELSDDLQALVVCFYVLRVHFKESSLVIAHTRTTQHTHRTYITYTHTHTHTHTHTYTHIHTYTHTHPHIHTHTYTLTHKEKEVMS